MKISSEEQMKPLWDLNEKYPEYVHCVEFDHASEPKHNLNLVKVEFAKKRSAAIQKSLNKCNEEIDIAVEDGLPVAELLAKRKRLRAFGEMSLENLSTIDEILATWPKELDEYLLKN